MTGAIDTVRPHRRTRIPPELAAAARVRSECDSYAVEFLPAQPEHQARPSFGVVMALQGSDGRAICILADHPGNPGRSVANGAPHIASLVLSHILKDADPNAVSFYETTYLCHRTGTGSLDDRRPGFAALSFAEIAQVGDKAFHLPLPDRRRADFFLTRAVCRTLDDLFPAPRKPAPYFSDLLPGSALEVAQLVARDVDADMYVYSTRTTGMQSHGVCPARHPLGFDGLHHPLVPADAMHLKTVSPDHARLPDQRHEPHTEAPAP